MPGVQVVGRWPSSQAATSSMPGISRPGVAVVLVVGVQLRKPARHLAFQEALRLAEIGEAHRDVVDGAELGQRVGHRQAHAVAHPGIAGVQGRQALAGVEAVDRLHQVEDGVAEHTRVLAGGDQVGVRDVGTGQCGKDFRFPQDHAVAARAQVSWPAPQHIGPAGPGESHHDVLGSTGDGGNLL